MQHLDNSNIKCFETEKKVGVWHNLGSDQMN